MFHQLLTPVGDSLTLSFLVALLPIATVLVLLGLFRRPAWQAALAGLAVGSVEGLEAASQWNAAQKAGCTGGGACPTTPALGDLSSARSDALVSDVAFVIGGVALAAGVVALVVPRGEKSATRAVVIHLGPFGAAVSGEL